MENNMSRICIIYEKVLYPLTNHGKVYIMKSDILRVDL